MSFTTKGVCNEWFLHNFLDRYSYKPSFQLHTAVDMGGVVVNQPL